jgi:hypothetical protein
MPRPSQLDPDVPVSVHPAPDVLGFRFCSCGCGRDKIRGLLEGYFSSSYYGCHRLESMFALLRRTSPSKPDLRLSPHPAPSNP